MLIEVSYIDKINYIMKVGTECGGFFILIFHSPYHENYSLAIKKSLKIISTYKPWLQMTISECF
jgi:penicillin-binding protein-related factor A (putative recombinase)